MSPKRWLARLAALLDSAKEKPDEDAPDETEKTEAADSSKALDQTREALRAIRTDLANYGTAIGVGTTLVIGASAWGSLDSLFPLPHSPKGWIPWAIVTLTFLMAVVGAVSLTARFHAARRRILIDTLDFERAPAQRGGFKRVRGGLDDDEYKLVERRLGEFAQEEGASTAAGVEARAERLQRVASLAKVRGEGEVAAFATAEAQRLNAGLLMAIGESALLVLERRAAAVYGGWLTLTLALVMAIGTTGTFVVADWSKGERDRLDSWVDCQKNLKDKDVPAARLEACAPLRPPVSSPSGSTSVPPAASDSRSEPVPTLSPSADLGIIERLDSCAQKASQKALPPNLREQAIAACAGIPPVPTPAGTGSAK